MTAMAHIITASEVSTLARPVYTDDTKTSRFIAESEAMDIRKRTGDAIWAWVLDEASCDDPRWAVVVNGGPWTDASGAIHACMGLKCAAAYYTYSRIVTQGNVDMTRVGTVNRAAPNAERSDWNERLQVSREAAAIGQAYLDEVMRYIESDVELSAMAHPRRNDSHRTRISVIGQ